MKRSQRSKARWAARAPVEGLTVVPTPATLNERISYYNSLTNYALAERTMDFDLFFSPLRDKRRS